MQSLATFLLILLFASTYHALPAAPGNFTFSLSVIEGAGHAHLKSATDASGARAASLEGRADEAASTLTPFNRRYVVMNVGVGDPVIYRQLLFDTGSAITWCQRCIPSPHAKPTGQLLHSTYGVPGGKSAFFEAHALKDSVSFDSMPPLVIEDQVIGIAIRSHNLDWLDGVVGLGPTGLTRGKMWPDQAAEVPTVLDNLFAQELIREKSFGVFLPPLPSGNDAGEGSVTFGGVNPGLYVGQLTYVPVTRKNPASQFWGIDIRSCTFGDGNDARTIIPTSAPGIVDFGAPMIFLANDYFETYMKAIPGAYLDKDTALMVVRRNTYRKMKPLHFDIGGRVLTLDVDAQLIPLEDNEQWGGTRGRHYSYIGQLGAMSNRGDDFHLGLPFLRRFYTAFASDHTTGERQIGFAETEHTYTKPSN